MRHTANHVLAGTPAESTMGPGGVVAAKGAVQSNTAPTCDAFRLLHITLYPASALCGLQEVQQVEQPHYVGRCLVVNQV